MTTFPRSVPLACAFVLLAVLGGCSSDDSSSAGDQSPSPSLSLVGLGDSLPGALNCLSPCQSYVQSYGELASEQLAQDVTTTNLATNDSLESGQLLERVRQDPTHRAAVAEADLVTITIGFNDWQGPCGIDEAKKCLSQGQKVVESNLTKILQEIQQLRDGKPTAIRVTGYYNMNTGNPNSPGDWGFSGTAAQTASFESLFAESLRNFNAMICRVAELESSVCVDLVSPFNGPNGNEDAGKLLAYDHVHPAESGQLLIAESIANEGYAPLLD